MQRALPFFILLAISLALAALSLAYYASRNPLSSSTSPGGATGTPTASSNEILDTRDTPDTPASGSYQAAEWTLDAIGPTTWVGTWQAPSGPQYLVQDEAYAVWAFSGEGEVEWSLDMSGPIIGWGAVDARKDGHTQILLSDADKVHAMPISGQELADYPINPGVIISAMRVVDYDENGDYRCLIGLQDGTLLNHKKSGMASAGWHHKRRPHAVQVIEHVRAGSKDFVCTVDAQGVVMLLKRTGQRRERTPAELEPMPVRSVAFDVGAQISESALITRKIDGSVVRVNLGSGLHSSANTADSERLEGPVKPAWLRLTEDGPARFE